MIKFTQKTDVIEVTQTGLFGGPLDTYKRFIPGQIHYFINGQEVPREEFIRLLDIAKMAVKSE